MSMMTNTATRLITLIMLLQHKPNQKAADLAAELGISIRSLHRYIAMLEEMGIPVYSERGPRGGFSLMRGYKMPPLVFTPAEAVSVYLGTSLVGEMWGQLYQDAARGALAKLDNVLPDEQRQEVAWARRTLVATGMHRADHDHLAPFLEKLRFAVREYRQVRVAYRSRNQPEPSLRALDPYALVFRWGWWYVIGYCHLRTAVRSFRIDRIVTLRLQDDTFSIPDVFDIQSYLQTELHDQPQIQVKMRFRPEGAFVALDNRIYWNGIDEQPDGSVIVTFNVPDKEWAISTILSYSSLVTVLEPKELRHLVQERAQEIAAQY
jgi:predicted DNA-binding transcriptional regulator YafY